jgi:hypothetical protein
LPAWIILLLVSVFGVVMALPLLQLWFLCNKPRPGFRIISPCVSLSSASRVVSFCLVLFVWIYSFSTSWFVLVKADNISLVSQLHTYCSFVGTTLYSIYELRIMVWIWKIEPYGFQIVLLLELTG